MKPFAEVGSPLRGRLWLASPQVVPTQFIASASIALVITRRAMGFFNMTSLGAVAIGALLLRWMTDVLGTRDAARVRASAAIASGVVVHIAMRSREPESCFASRPTAGTTRASTP
ncbi:MAG: hypothetical protein AB7N61_13120 [Acidimicrobiia bacterium]